ESRIDSARGDVFIDPIIPGGRVDLYVGGGSPYTLHEWRHEHRRCVVRHGHAKTFLAFRRIEFFSSHHGFHTRHQRFQLEQPAFASHRALVGAPTANEEQISEHLT